VKADESSNCNVSRVDLLVKGKRFAHPCQRSMRGAVASGPRTSDTGRRRVRVWGARVKGAACCERGGALSRERAGRFGSTTIH